MFCGVVRDAVGFKTKFDRAIRSAHAVEKVEFFDGMCGSDCSVEKIGIEKALFRLRKNARFVLDRKSSFSIHRSDCIRIGLRMRVIAQGCDRFLFGQMPKTGVPGHIEPKTGT